MQRKITADSELTFKTPKPSKTIERQFGKAVSSMIAAMGVQFENETLEKLNQKTIEKFEGKQFGDAQTGNYAGIFLNLSKTARKKLLAKFSDDRLKELAKQILSKSDKLSTQQFYANVEKEIGIDTKELIRTEGLKPETNALILETTEWLKVLRDETLQEFTANTLRVMSTGADFETVMNQYRGTVKAKKNHAKFIARNQIQNFNSISTKIKAQNLGVTEAKWLTSEDERVRLCHKVRNGKRFKLSEGLFSSCDGKTLLPGIDFNCRCTYEMIIPEE